MKKSMMIFIGLMVVINLAYADSLWKQAQFADANTSLYRDDRASQIGDIITVLIVEQAAMTQQATSNTSRDSNIKGEVKDWVGLQFKGVKVDTDPATGILPKWEIDTTNEFKGSGTYKGDYAVTGTITTRVIDILTNGDLVIEGKSMVKNNEEENIIALSGIVRPQDIGPNNTVLSTQVADKTIHVVGRGPINDKTKRGVLGKFLDWFWPF